jgi:hypothetical protein
MRRAIAPVLAISLLALSATVAAAAETYRERSTASGPDEFWSGTCGFEVLVTARTSFQVVARADGTAQVRFGAVRSFSGPGGTIRQTLAYTWSVAVPAVSEDPTTETVVVVTREVLHGTRTWSAPGAGIVTQDAGYYDATITTTASPNGETVEVSNETAHGSQPGSPIDPAVFCAAVG